MMKSSTIRSAALALSLGVLSPPVFAQEAAGAGRFSMSPTPEGYLKLDSRTGDVTECRRNADQGYRCTLTPDERAALQSEIDRLAGENAALRQAMQAQGVQPPANARGTAVPSDQEFDRAMTLMERFMRRFMAIMKDEQPPVPKPPATP